MNAHHPLTVTCRATESLHPDPRNARTHSKRQIEQIAASIRQFGFTNPVLIDPEGVLIAGHGRVLAAKSIGMSEVPTITLAGLNDAEKRALRLADNKVALGAGWDLELLRVELAELSSLDVAMDLTVTGFSIGELNVLLGGDAQSSDDVIPPLPDKPRTKPGDIWILGDHVVGCGDGRDREFLDKVVGKRAQIDAAFLDPPDDLRLGGYVNPKERDGEVAIASAEGTDEAFPRFLTETLGAAAAVSRDGAVHFVCMDWRNMIDVCAVGQAIYGDLLDLCIWNKSQAGTGPLYRSKHELVFVYRVGSAPPSDALELRRDGRHRNNVWDYASVKPRAVRSRKASALRQTVKPTALVADAPSGRDPPWGAGA
jgi:ParB-like nuclease domain